MSDLKNDRENVVFWRNLHHWQKSYIATGSDTSHLWGSQVLLVFHVFFLSLREIRRREFVQFWTQFLNFDGKFSVLNRDWRDLVEAIGYWRKLGENWQKLACFLRHHLSVLRRCNFSAGRLCLWQCLFLSSTISFSVLRRDQNHQNWLLNVSILSSQRRWKLIGVVSFGPTFCGTRNVPAVTFINLSKTKYKQGSRSWQPFIEGKKGHEKLRKARIYYFCDKCIVFGA